MFPIEILMPIYTAAQRLLKSAPPFQYNLAARYFLTNLRTIENRTQDEGTHYYSYNINTTNLLHQVQEVCPPTKQMKTQAKIPNERGRRLFEEKSTTVSSLVLIASKNTANTPHRSLRTLIWSRRRQHRCQSRS